MTPGPSRIQSCLEQTDDRSALTPWLEDVDAKSVAVAFDLFYSDVLAHGRVNPAEAQRVVTRVRRLWLRRLEESQRARFARLQAHTYRMGGDMTAATRAYGDAFSAFEATGNELEIGRTAIGWLDVLAFHGEFAHARRVAERGRRALRGKDRLAAARLESNWGNVLYLSGQLGEAAKVFRSARRRLLAAGYERDAALISWNLGQVHLLHGQLRRARTCFTEARKVFVERGFESSALRCEFGLAAADLVEGDWTNAAAKFERLQERFQQIGDERGTAATLWEFSRFLGAVGAEASAAKVGELAYDKFDQLGLRRDAAHVSQLLARWLNELGEPLEARVRLNQALSYHETTGDRVSKTRVEIELADTLLRLGRSDEALRRLRKLRVAVHRSADRGTRVRHLSRLAAAYQAQKKAGLALTNATKAYELASGYPEKLERPELAMICASACADKGDPEHSWRWAKRATRLVDRMYSDLGVTGVRTQVSARRRSIYRRSIELILALSPADGERKAVELLGRSLSTNLVEAIVADSLDVDRALGTAIARMREMLLSPEGGKGSDTRFRSAKRELTVLEKKLSRGGRRRDSGSLDRVLSKMNSRDSVRDWKRRLQGSPLVIYDVDVCESDRFVSRAYLLATNGKVHCVELPDAARALREIWSPLRMIMDTAAHLPQDRRTAFLERTQREAERSMVELRQALLDPLQLSAGARVHVIPGESLQGLPLEALAATAAPGKRSILVRWPHPSLVRTASSAGGQSPRRAVILGDGRPNTRSECVEVSRLMRRASISAQRMTKRRQFVNNSQRISALHVAAHGVHHREEWMLNGIRLADRWMGFEHLRPKQLKDALIYFSSCESGLLASSNQAEMNGWMVAGLRAGARSMVMTLWKIDDDAARDFARSFYASWTGGEEVAESLALAQAQLRARRPHPFAWAPFMAIG